MDPAARVELLREARAMAKLRSPGVCPIHEINTESDPPFLVMEWVDGQRLTDAMRDRPVDARVAVLRTVTAAVAELHSAGLLHGDLKPANVLVDSAGRPLLVDFGLARPADGAMSLRGGTPGYAAPEQFGDEGLISPRSDVFGLGVLLYELLTGQQPFLAETRTQMLELVRRGECPLPQELAPQVPAALQRIALTAMEPDAERRYPDAGAMLADIDRALRGDQVAARPSRLTSRLFEQVDAMLATVDGWSRVGLATDRERVRLQDVLRQVRRPESHWIIEARVLTVSQVMLYVGGWLALVALTVGMAMAWDAFDAWGWMRIAIPASLLLLMASAGAYFWRHGDQRIGIGFFVTANLALVIAASISLREGGWLAKTTFASEPMIASAEVGDHTATEEGATTRERASTQERARGTERALERGSENPNKVATKQTLPKPLELSVVVLAATIGRGAPSADELGGVRNVQLLLIGVMWAVASFVMRRQLHSGAFTLMLSLGVALSWAALFASSGALRDEAERLGWLGAWLAGGGGVLLAVGLRLNDAEERREARAGELQPVVHDAWSLAGLGLALVLGGLALAAWNWPGPFTLGLVSDGDAVRQRSWAFIVAGAIVFVCMLLVERVRTPLRERLVTVMRLVTPSSFAIPLVILETRSDGWNWLGWTTALVGVAFVAAVASAVRNWKPFLLSGLVYLGVAYVRTTIRLADSMDGDRHRVAAMVMIATIVFSLAFMVASRLGGTLAARWRRRTLG